MVYCPKCGMQNADGSIYCSRCGSAMGTAQTQGGSPTVVVVGNGGQQAPVGSNPGTVWLWLNIILTVLSCCSNILGIIGIVFGAISVSNFNNGRYAESKSNANVSKWLFIISIILGVVGTIVGLVAGLFPMLFALIQTAVSGGFDSFDSFQSFVGMLIL